MKIFTYTVPLAVHVIASRLHTTTCAVFSQVNTHGCLKFTGQRMGVGAYTETGAYSVRYMDCS